jgi:hypothetical protein
MNEMPKIPRKQTLSYLVTTIRDMEDSIREGGRGTPAGRKRLLDFLREVRQNVRAFCLAEFPESDHVYSGSWILPGEGSGSKKKKGKASAPKPSPRGKSKNK